MRLALRGVPYLLVLLSVSTALADGSLGTLRGNVRPSPASPSPASPSPPPPPPSRDPPAVVEHHHYHHDCDDDDDSDGTAALYLLGGIAFVYGVTSPFWGPHSALNDDFDIEGHFPRFPYSRVPGYMVSSSWPGSASVFEDPTEGTDFDSWLTRPRRWSARVRADYGEDFDDLTRIGGHLLLSTTSRWGLDAEMNYFQENLPAGATDELWIGDCNVIFRFAQNERMQWRTGIGFNWLDDTAETNFGFNFTYGLDYFPAKPWILSATLDWGTLGDAELFHFRTTAGAIVFGMETYAGYEYYDIDQVQINSLIAGVRIWF